MTLRQLFGSLGVCWFAIRDPPVRASGCNHADPPRLLRPLVPDCAELRRCCAAPGTGWSRGAVCPPRRPTTGPGSRWSCSRPTEKKAHLNYIAIMSLKKFQKPPPHPSMRFCTASQSGNFILEAVVLWRAFILSLDAHHTHSFITPCCCIHNLGVSTAVAGNILPRISCNGPVSCFSSAPMQTIFNICRIDNSM